jgi:hypothetical protein
MSLSEAISSAVADSAPAETTPAAPETASVTEQAEAPTEGLIGLPEQTVEAPTDSKFTLADGIAEDQVLYHDSDGKPVTAKDVQASYFRQADYTRKTQELAQAKEVLGWIEKNQGSIQTAAPILDALASGDKAALAQAIKQIADQQAVELPQGRQRDEQGRFAKAEPDAELYDLEQMAELHGADSLAYDMAVRTNAAIMANRQLGDKLNGVDQQLKGFFGQLQQQQQQAQNLAAINEVAQGWKANGFQPDTEGAAALIGKTITPQQAMILHNFEGLQRHNVRIAKGTPPAKSEPGGAVSGKTGVSPEGKSLTQYINETMFSLKR